MKLPRLHQKNRAYYHVSGGKPRKWTPLGSNLALALREYRRIESGRQSHTVAGVVDAFMAEKHAWSDGTRKVYAVLSDHLIRVLGHMNAAELGRRDVLEYIDRCPRKTVTHEISLLRQAYERAVRSGAVESNPCIGAKPLQRIVSRRDRLITDAEYAAIKSKASPLLAAAMDLAFLTALRISDLCRLRWGDLEAGIQTGKTGVRLRFAADDDLRAALDAAHALQGRVATLTVLSNRGRPVTSAHLRQQWEKACADAGVANAQFRDLRAKSASDDPDEAQHRLGHTTPNMTRTYLRGRAVKEVAPAKRRRNP